MMVLYSGTTCPFSHRCRFVLFEKGMDFEIRDVDLYNKPEDISVMNPYGQVPILVERDLILYESNIINEYIDERFPHPQLMPGDPVDRARVRLFLLNFEKELFVHVSTLESRNAKGNEKVLEKASKWVANYVGTVRPTVTYIFILELVAINAAIAWYAFNEPGMVKNVDDLIRITTVIFSDDEMAMLGGIIGFWFGTRSWGKK
jgi:glutaredoxin